MSTPRLARPLDGKERAPRIVPQQGLQVLVDSNTLGVPQGYRLPVENLSLSGLLLTRGSYRHVPYQINTLIELAIDPEGGLLDRPIHCLGKVVRLTTESGHRREFGIQIIHMDSKDQTVWEKGLAALPAP